MADEKPTESGGDSKEKAEGEMQEVKKGKTMALGAGGWTTPWTSSEALSILGL